MFVWSNLQVKWSSISQVLSQLELVKLDNTWMTKPFFSSSWAFAISFQEYFQNYIFFSLTWHIKVYPSSLSTYNKTTSTCIKRKSDNHVIMETNLSAWTKSPDGNDLLVWLTILSSRFNKVWNPQIKNLSHQSSWQLYCNRCSDIGDTV